MVHRRQWSPKLCDKGEEFSVRVKAIDALRRLGPQAIPDLKRLIEDEWDDEDLRAQAVGALPSMGVEAIPLLEEVIDGDNRRLRRTAIESVWKMGEDSTQFKPLLGRLAAYDDDASIRRVAREALKKMGVDVEDKWDRGGAAVAGDAAGPPAEDEYDAPAPDDADMGGGADSEGKTVEESPKPTEPTANASAPAPDNLLQGESRLPWYDDVEIHYDTNKPWNEARREIRRLLALGGESRKEAIKLTCIYRDKNDIGDGHEYPMYLYLGGEYALAAKSYVEFLENNPPGHSSACAMQLASCYTHLQEYDKALGTLETALKSLPESPWRILHAASIHNAYGDIYVVIGKVDEAKTHYAEAARLFPTSKQPYGRDVLKHRTAGVQSKIDMLDCAPLSTAALSDGIYRIKALGYSGDVDVEVTIEAQKITDIQIRPPDAIDQGATKLIPQQIIAKQSLDVDAISGATVTRDAILDGVFRALRQAGLE